MSRFKPCSLTLLALLSTSPAWAQQAPKAHALSLGFESSTYKDYYFISSVPLMALDVAYTRGLGPEGLDSAWLLRAGVRLTPMVSSGVPLEGYLRLQATARLGTWQPAVGPELGLSGASASSEEPAAPFYLGFHAAPLRVRLGSFLLSALELQVSTTTPEWGTTTRLQFGFFQFGGVL